MKKDKYEYFALYIKMYHIIFKRTRNVWFRHILYVCNGMVMMLSNSDTVCPLVLVWLGEKCTSSVLSGHAYYSVCVI